jgi:hypothetical protein
MPWSSGGGNEWGLHRNWVSQERISAELRCPTIESEMRNVKVAIVKYGTIATSGLEFGPGSGSSVIDVGGGEIWVGGTKLLSHLIGEALAALDLWWARIFGRPLSGRINRLEIQTLFHGNTKDQDQI